MRLKPRVLPHIESRFHERIPAEWHATKGYTFTVSPVTGLMSCIVGPDQSTSIVCPAL